MARVYLSPPHIAGREAELVAEAIESNWIAPLGPHVDAFEAEVAAVAGVENAVALTSGTAALHLALVVLGIGEGDEVACSDFTFAASANPITYAGATPFFVDADEATWTIDPALLDRAIAERRAAGGRRPSRDRGRPLRPVLRLRRASGGLRAPRRRPDPGCDRVARRDVPGSAVGRAGRASRPSPSTATRSSRRAAAGCSSPRNRDWIEHARKLSTQAREPVVHYEHTEIGFNYRMSNLLAALGRAQLETLPMRVAARRRIRDRYRELLDGVPGVTFMPEAAYGTSNAWLTCIVLDPDAFGADRETVRLALEAEDIEARPLWKPMHLQPIFASHRTFGGEVGARLFERGLCLPSGSSLTDDDQDRVVATILSSRSRR